MTPKNRGQRPGASGQDRIGRAPGARILIAIALALPIGAREPVRVPVDLETLNGYADQYNRYVEELQSGVVDVKQWERVERARKAIR